MTTAAPSSLRLAVLGAGGVGRTVGAAWSAAGHQVRYGVREPSRYADLPGAVGVAEALADAGAVLLAVPGTALGPLLDEHAATLDGRLLLDATNQVGGHALHQVPLFAERVPAARVARVFCTVGREVMAAPRIDGQTADLFWCGPDGPDRDLVDRLVTDVGLRPVRVGDLGAADVVDGVTRLWFALALHQGHGRHLGLRMVTGRD